MHPFDPNIPLATSVTALIVVALIVYIVKASLQHVRYKFPPSPPGRLPVIGHNHLFPKQFTGDKAKEWGLYTITS